MNSNANLQIDSIVRDLLRLQRFVIQNPEYEDNSCLTDDLQLLADEVESVMKSRYTPPPR